MAATRYLSNNSKSLLADVNTNVVEQFNSIIAKYTGGKRINFTLKRSNKSRCMAATISANTRTPLYRMHKHLNNGVSPERILKKHEMTTIAKSNRRYPTCRRKLKLKQGASADKDYGENCVN